MRNWITVALLAAAIAASGCASKKPKPEVPTDAGQAAGATTGAAGSAGASTSGFGTELGMGDTDATGPQGELLGKRVVYFEFDRAELRSDDAAVVAAHARYLSSNPGTRVRLEGHTDERGTREYNIGLGERRAQTVRRAMLLQGAAEAQVVTVSYGEERPAAAGSDEVAWGQNRRVEIVYLQ